MEEFEEGDNDVRYTQEMADRLWFRLKDEIGSAGFREGIDEGQQKTLQSGFNAGYKEGAQYAYQLGVFQGSLRVMKENLERDGVPISMGSVMSDIDGLLEELETLTTSVECAPEQRTASIHHMQERVENMMQKTRPIVHRESR